MYVYHYLAEHQMKNGAVVRCDGIIDRSLKITKWDDYKSLKQDIVNLMELDVPAKEISICSISLIHED